MVATRLDKRPGRRSPLAAIAGGQPPAVLAERWKVLGILDAFEPVEGRAAPGVLPPVNMWGVEHAMGSGIVRAHVRVVDEALGEEVREERAGPGEPDVDVGIVVGTEQAARR